MCYTSRSVDSFTPVLNGEVRSAELALLYDPQRTVEAKAAKALFARFKANDFGWRIRRNYPYVGYSDGFTTYLRKRFALGRYAGLEIEMNQGIANTAMLGQKRLIQLIGQALEMA